MEPICEWTMKQHHANLTITSHSELLISTMVYYHSTTPWTISDLAYVLVTPRIKPVGNKNTSGCKLIDVIDDYI